MIPHITKEQVETLFSSGPSAVDCTVRAFNLMIDKANEAAQPRTTVNGESMTFEAAQKLFEQTKETHDWFQSNSEFPNYALSESSISFGVRNIYNYAPKAPKLKPLDWSRLPVGVAVTCKDIDDGNSVFIYQGGTPPLVTQDGMSWQGRNTLDLRLAPASEQKWIAVQDSHPDMMTTLRKLSADGIQAMAGQARFKITGVASGYTDGGAV